MTTNRKVLVTAGRFDPATAIVRGFHKAGINVHAADSYKMAPALHSHSTTGHVVPSPSQEPVRFTESVATIVGEEKIDLVVPSFEEGFYLSRYRDLIPAPLFAPPFATIKRLHNKANFTQLCSTLNLPIPQTITVTDCEELRKATAQFDEFVARPAYSRGGLNYLTNHGPRAGEKSIDDCDPSPENPWLVQEYIEGRDACSFSVVRNGKIVLHCVYEPSIAAVGGWSLQFTSITDFGTFERASKIAEHFTYNGFLSFDYRRTKDGFVMIECNPRVSAGAFLTPEEWIGPAVFDDPGDVRRVEPGMRRQYDVHLLDPHFNKLPPAKLIRELLTPPDAFFNPNDLLPALYFLICRRHWSVVAKKEHTTMAHAFLDDITWDGSPMPELIKS